MSEDQYRKIFSKNLRKYMEKNEKTQVDLINDLGLNRSSISTWCNGTRLPRMDKVDILANYFGIKRSDLIEDKEEQEQPTYYLNEETKEIAQEIFENKELRLLFDAGKGNHRNVYTWNVQSCMEEVKRWGKDQDKE